MKTLSSAKEANEKSPALIAREVFRLLGQKRISPTPEAYRKLYYEVSGAPDPHTELAPPVVAEEKTVNQREALQPIIASFARKLIASHSDVADIGHRILRAVKTQDWEEYNANLVLIFDRYLKTPPKNEVPSPVTSRPLPENEQLANVRALLAKTLSLPVASLLKDEEALSVEAESLGKSLEIAQTDKEFKKANARLKELSYKIELKTGSIEKQQALLLNIFKLLLDNMSELAQDDSWLSGQIAIIQNILSGSISYGMLEEATASLKEVIYRQGVLKFEITESREKFKELMITFVDQLSTITESTTTYHEKIGKYADRLSDADNIGDFTSVFSEILVETKNIQNETELSRNKIVATKQEAEEAERRIHELEEKLEHLSELVREDQLTGSLNRRGLDDAYEREVARSDRRNTTLCVALLDLDNFKNLNDTLGHAAGDQALIHLVRVVKETLRPMDVVARFGGEEFLILLPETDMADAKQILQRVQRAMTRHFFMHQEEHILITFSAGVVKRRKDESQEDVVNRADAAMYQAKMAGKNRVIAIDD